LREFVKTVFSQEFAGSGKPRVISQLEILFELGFESGIAFKNLACVPPHTAKFEGVKFTVLPNHATPIENRPTIVEQYNGGKHEKYRKQKHKKDRSQGDVETALYDPTDMSYKARRSRSAVHFLENVCADSHQFENTRKEIMSR
jgi:hypothetical protein